MSLWSSSSEKLLSREEEEDSNDYASEISVERRPVAMKSTRWHCFIYFAVVHTGLLTIYTAIVFSLWPKAGSEALSETYSE